MRQALLAFFLFLTVTGFLGADTVNSVLAQQPATGQYIVLTILDSLQSPSIPGATYDFQGTIGNNTGADFAISDLTFNFLGYDPTQIDALNPLPTSPTFNIPDGTTSPVVTLFDLTLDPSVSPDGVYQSDLIVSDPQGNYSNDVTVTILPVPEPGTFGVVAGMLIGLTVLAGWRAKGYRLRRSPGRTRASDQRGHEEIPQGPVRAI